MRLRVAYLYSAFAVAFAVTFGVAIGPYWVDDAVGLAAIAFVALMVALSAGQGMKTLTSWWAPASRESQLSPTNQPTTTTAGGRRYVPRSKIAHFVLLSRIRFRTPVSWDSYNAFERALLSRGGWQNLTAEELKVLVEGRRA